MPSNCLFLTPPVSSNHHAPLVTSARQSSRIRGSCAYPFFCFSHSVSAKRVKFSFSANGFVRQAGCLALFGRVQVFSNTTKTPSRPFSFYLFWTKTKQAKARVGTRRLDDSRGHASVATWGDGLPAFERAPPQPTTPATRTCSKRTHPPARKSFARCSFPSGGLHSFLRRELEVNESFLSLSLPPSSLSICSPARRVPLWISPSLLLMLGSRCLVGSGSILCLFCSFVFLKFLVECFDLIDA